MALRNLPKSAFTGGQTSVPKRTLGKILVAQIKPLSLAGNGKLATFEAMVMA
jgi:hypothetical protein